MDSSFISSKVKLDFCKNITQIKASEVAAAVAPSMGSEVQYAKISLVKYRQRIVMMMSMMLGVITSLTTVFYTFVNKDSTKGALDHVEILLPMLAALMTLLAATFITYVRRIEVRRQERHKDEDD